MIAQECSPLERLAPQRKNPRFNMPIPAQSTAEYNRPVLPKRKREALKVALKSLEEWQSIEEIGSRSWKLSRLSSRFFRALQTIEDSLEANRKKCSGVLILKGTRFPLSQLFAELADGKSIKSIARSFDLDREQMSNFLHAIAVRLDVPVSNE